MLHVALRSNQSRRRLVSHLICAASLLAGAPAFAKKKAAAAVEESPAATTESAPTGDPKLVPPPADTFGRVHFGPSSAPDLGRVSVKAPASDDVKVFLEGRFFGTAPVTIYSVPKGDYIIEGTYPDGKTVSKAVSVLENDEAVADLTGAHAALVETKKGGGMFSSKEISPGRLFAMKAFAIGGGAALVLGVTFGILEMRKESDYRNSTGTQADLDKIASTGKTYALLANVGYALAFVGVAGAAVCAYPLFVKPNAEKKTVALAPRPLFMIVPASAGSGATGAMSLRF
ncbi:MAG TPA: hypothetical protein VFH68_03190 [Polyangia bacterium]|jgi:hypothetical protein|nr:hypothetical protein [Polyangia bacterium]